MPDHPPPIHDDHIQHFRLPSVYVHDYMILNYIISYNARSSGTPTRWPHSTLMSAFYVYIYNCIIINYIICYNGRSSGTPTWWPSSTPSSASTSGPWPQRATTRSLLCYNIYISFYRGMPAIIYILYILYMYYGRACVRSMATESTTRSL